MDDSNITAALQDLIIRLQDAEKGYKEISNATSNVTLKNWAKTFAEERHQMHRALEKLSKLLGGEPKVKTSFLGDLHRMFIDVKLNAIDHDYESAIAEIERGSSKLLEDYDRVLAELKLPNDIAAMLNEQKLKIAAEVEALKALEPAR